MVAAVAPKAIDELALTVVPAMGEDELVIVTRKELADIGFTALRTMLERKIKLMENPAQIGIDERAWPKFWSNTKHMPEPDEPMRWYSVG